MSGLVEEFFKLTGHPYQAQLDYLRHRAVPTMAPVYDGDCGGYPLGVARVERYGKQFHFREEDGVRAYLFIARDEDGEPADIVAWASGWNWVAPWRGHVAVLGQHEILAPRLGEPLQVHRDVLGWLRAGRNGIVLLPGNRNRVRLLLEGYTLLAEDVQHGHELRRILATPAPRIVMPNVKGARAA